MSPVQVKTYGNYVAHIVHGMDPGINLPGCQGPSCYTERFLKMGCTKPDGEAASVAVCAKTIAGVFKGVATTPAGSPPPGGKGSPPPGKGPPTPGGKGSPTPGKESPTPGSTTGSSSPGSTGSPAPGSAGSATQGEPLGELFSVNLELAGLKGQSVFLSWSIFQEAGPTHLSGLWLSNFVAYRLEATTNDDTGTLEMWIPLPRQPGPYFVQLTLTTNGVGLASKDSGPFD